jgi:hypothetical protein
MMRSTDTPRLLDAVKRILDQAVEDPDLVPLSGRLETLRTKLDEPLRVSVSGQVSAGKSTLVNALVGRRVAATGESETTEVNAWFRHRPHGPECAVLRRLGGELVTVPLLAAQPLPPLPALPDLDKEAVDPITVYLNAPFLEDIVVIDSPGLFSPNEENSARTAMLLRRTELAAKAADALLYVTHEVPGATRDDRELEAFQSQFGAGGNAPTSALLILSKVDVKWDKYGNDPREPIQIGLDLIKAHGSELWKRVWSARPVIGAVAELVRAGSGLTARQAADLAALSRTPLRRRLVGSDAGLDRAHVPDVPLERRVALRASLGAWGLYRAMELAERDADADTIAQSLLAESGLSEVLVLVNEVFRARSDLIRSESALEALDQLGIAARDDVLGDAADRLRAAVERLLLSPDGQPLNAIRALRLACDEDRALLRLQDGRRLELRRLFASEPAHVVLGARGDAPSSVLAGLARERWRWWKALEEAVPNTPERRWLAGQACDTYVALMRDLDRAAPFTAAGNIVETIT